VNINLRAYLVIVMTAIMVFGTQARAASENESLGQKIKKLFVRPTPTPTPHKKKRKKVSHAVKKETPAPASAAADASEESNPRTAETTSDYFEPVRPISPGPRSRARKHKSPPTEEAPARKATPALSARESRTPSPAISAAEIADYESYSPEVRKILDSALSLTSQDLRYKYGSADPAKGGMDSSGFVYHLLLTNGIKDVPRDARAQYVWVRKAGNFRAVLAQTNDTFELDELQPGDLLFWAGAYSISREPNITQTMIYLGRDKATNQRLMVGASDGGTYKGESRGGVRVFDFKAGRLRSKSGNEPGAMFVGYGRPPGLPGQQ
jgi:cell wall-associated NlpC family hydrolase